MDEFVWEPVSYGVYIRMDSEGRITAINSDAFLQSMDGWTKIDEGLGDSYHHAQGNYLPGPLMDRRGICRYKLVEGHVQVRTEEEIEAEAAGLPEPEPSTEELLLETAGDHEYRLCLLELGLTENEVI